MVEALLEENDRLSGYLSDPPFQRAGTAEAGLVPGVRLGRYTIVDQLGSGGMGVVYRARDEKLERLVAIKMVSKGVLASEEARRHFRREALALAKLNHARIAAVYDVGEQDGADFLVMELVQGQSLAAKLRAGPLPVAEATAILRQVAEALGEAHELGVIHRDLKPANVMITPKGDVKVLDFGLAKLLASGVDSTVSVAETGGVFGTPAYMSPEQALGKTVDVRTDLWSLGVMYYECLVGRPPFAGDGTLAVLHAIIGAPLTPIRTIRPELPPLAEYIVTRALEKECDLRYQRAAEIETDLKRLARDLDPGLPSVSSVPAPGSWPTAQVRRKKRGVPMLAGAAGVVLVLALAYLLRPTVPLPRVTAIKQITNDGKRKSYMEGYRVQNTMATDGLRVYFPVLDLPPLLQVSTGGGESEPVPVPFDFGALTGLSPAKSELLLQGPPSVSGLNEGGLWTMPVLGGQARRIGNIIAFDATWSPDGASIYYTEGTDIWVARSDGSQSHKILTMSGTPNWIRFSPDGKLFRFGVLNGKLNTNTLWEARADGSGVRQLLSGDAWTNGCCGAWTPDGKYFVFESNRGGKWNLWTMREKQDWWRKTNPEPVQLTTGEMIAQSALPSLDGKGIFFVGVTRRSELVRFDARKRAFESYLPGISAEEVAFSRDGSRIAYVSFPEGNIWVCNPDGSDRRELTFAPLMWGPLDGRRTEHKSHSTPFEPGKSTSKIYVIPAEGGNPEQLTTGNELEGDDGEIDPAWSSNGEDLAFGSSYGAAISSRKYSIQILNLKSRKLTALPDSSGYFSPRWSPDGRWMIALDGHSPGLQIYDFNNRKWEELTKLAAGYPSWSKDSQCIYFNVIMDSENKVVEYRLCLKDRKPQAIADSSQVGATMSEFGGWSGITPDGSFLAVRDISLEEIYSAELDLP